MNAKTTPQPPAQLSRVSVVWIWARPNKQYSEIESHMLHFAGIIMPKLPNAWSWYHWDRRFNEAYYINGRVEVRFQSLTRSSNGELIAAKNPPWTGRIFLKKIDGVWHLCLEIQLNKRFLEQNGIPRDVPKSTDPWWVRRTGWWNFLEFGLFNVELVVDELKSLLKTKKQDPSYTPKDIKNLRRCIQDLECKSDLPDCQQKTCAIQAADIFKSRYIKYLIDTGEFDIPYEPEDMPHWGSPFIDSFSTK